MFNNLAMLWEEDSHLSEAQRQIRKAALEACKYQVPIDPHELVALSCIKIRR